MAPEQYQLWKRGFVEAALRRNGLAPNVLDCAVVPAQSRRRARFFAEMTPTGVDVGFHERASHDVVDMNTCLILDSALLALTGELRAYFAKTLSRSARAEAEAQVVAGALDLLIRERGVLDLEKREDLVRFAVDAGIARLSWQGLETKPARPKRGRGRRPPAPSAPEVIIERNPVTAHFGGVKVVLPPLAFVQVSAAGEEILRDAVVAAVPEGARVADLYSGAGTFTLPLSDGRQVTAIDGDGDLINALNAAARAAGLGARVLAEHRNLKRRPLVAKELAPFDAVVLDPPRAGAIVQVRELAASAVGRVVMVSCNPESFARDAKVLVEGGYDMGPVLPVDQFFWTRHLELVAVFSR
jgi:23S rRNA (uracil1939-C5)-methyltransferase